MTPLRVAVTGAGSLCPIAHDLPSFRKEMETGVSRATRIEADLASRLSLNQSRRLDRLAQILLIASTEAASAARLADVDPERVGLVVGTGLGCLEKTESLILGAAHAGGARLDPLGFPESMDNAPAAHLAISLGCRGAALTVREREISGESALIDALGLLAFGAADAVLVAAGDAPGPPGESAVRRVLPRARIGEGAGAIVLETASSVSRRGARAMAWIAGWARSGGPVLRASRRPPPDAAAKTEARAWSMAGSGGERGGRIDERVLVDRIGWCPADGVLRTLAGIFLLEREDVSHVLVAGAARGGATAAIVLAPAGSP